MRLIDADNLKETIDYYIREAGWSNAINETLGWVKDEFIDAEPSVDIVRCKDCKFWHVGEVRMTCRKGIIVSSMATGYDYCSYAERKERE